MATFFQLVHRNNNHVLGCYDNYDTIIHIMSILDTLHPPSVKAVDVYETTMNTNKKTLVRFGDSAESATATAAEIVSTTATATESATATGTESATATVTEIVSATETATEIVSATETATESAKTDTVKDGTTKKDNLKTPNTKVAKVPTIDAYDPASGLNFASYESPCILVPTRFSDPRSSATLVSDEETTVNDDVTTTAKSETEPAKELEKFFQCEHHPSLQSELFV